MSTNPNINQYKLGGYYHVRIGRMGGGELFVDKEDYQKYQQLLHDCLAPSPKNERESIAESRLSDDVELLSYCLLYDHVHLLVQQHWLTSVTSLIDCLGRSYTDYFIAKYAGANVDVFEMESAVIEISDRQAALLVSKYIHCHGRIDEAVSGVAKLKSSLSDYKSNRFRPFISRNLLADSGMSSAVYLEYLDKPLSDKVSDYLFDENVT